MNELDGFRLYLLKTKTDKGRYRKDSTIRLHLDILRRLKKHIPALTVPELERYLLGLHEKGRTGTYLNAYIDTLHMFGRHIGTNAYEALKYFPEKEFVQATMSDGEIETFLNLPPPTSQRRYKSGKITSLVYDPSGYARWTLFFKILAYSGMRPGEVAHLTVEDVDLPRKVYVLRETKTNSFRLVPIAQIVLHDLTEYIQKLSGPLLFPATSGKSARQGDVVDDVDWGYNFHQRLKRMGLKRKNLRPNSLRPSFISRLGDEDINIFKIQRIVGHKDIRTTEHYMHLSTKQLVKTLDKDPLARKGLTYYERFKLVREGLTNLLESYALNSDEERQMRKDLF